MSPRKATCAGCPAIVSEDGPYMKCSKCKQVFDIFCANINENTFGTLTLECKKSWICVECRSKLPRGDNTHTPVRHIQDLSTTTNGPLNISMNSPDNVTMRTAARMAKSSNPSAGLKNIHDLKDTVIQELKSMQVDLESQLISKINNLIVEQFNSFKTEIMEKICILTSKVLELENQYKSSAEKPNTTPITKGHPSATNPTTKSKALKSKPPTNTNPTVNKATPNRPIRAITELTTVTVQDELSSSIPNSSDNKKCDEIDMDKGNTVENEWREVRPRRARASVSGVLRGTAAPGSTLLQASERWSYLHLYYVQEGTTVEQVSRHLKTICCSEACTVEQLKPRGRYSSFKLGVPTKNANSVMSSENWAKDICVKPWRHNFRAKAQSN